MKAKRLLLECYSDSEAFGPFLAVLYLSQERASWLNKQFALFKKVKQLDHEIYKICKSDYAPEFYETHSIGVNYTAKQEEQVEALFELAPDVLEDSLVAVLDSKIRLPESGVRLDYCVLEISGVSDLPVDIRWRMCIKHTNSEVCTEEISEQRFRELLEELKFNNVIEPAEAPK